MRAVSRNQKPEGSNSIAVGDGGTKLTLAAKRRKNSQKAGFHKLLITNQDTEESVGRGRQLKGERHGLVASFANWHEFKTHSRDGVETVPWPHPVLLWTGGSWDGFATRRAAERPERRVANPRHGSGVQSAHLLWEISPCPRKFKPSRGLRPPSPLPGNTSSGLRPPSPHPMRRREIRAARDGERRGN